ncbi:MAG TPA: SGNH/GDSL hydrolase family protein [Solirubrobacterales bacterium]|nr:SGNH/GDSL hydrolase family protein [Solirubrobacterales bacterium]
MSAFFRARTRLLVCAVVVVAFAALLLAPTAGAFGPGKTYLALGDSLAYGYHQALFQKELKEKGFVEAAKFNDGYVDDFAKGLKLLNPKLNVVNDGCPGETTETFIKGSGVGPGFCAGGPTGSPFPKAFLHHAYPGTQLEDALAIAEAPGTGTITLDIGANDILQFLGHTCGFPVTFSCSEAEVGAEIGHVVTNIGVILAQLRAAAPKAKIVFVSQYNPYPTVLSPEGRGDATVEALNAAIKSVAAGFGVKFANTARVINFSGTHGGPEAGDIPTVCAFTAMCPGGTFNPASPEADIHPTKAGYAAMAGVLGVAYLTP